MLFVLITDECASDARSHQMEGQLRKLGEEIEKKQNTSVFDRFPPPYLVKKKFCNRQGRLIGLEQTVHVDQEEHTVIVLLAVLIRGHDEYDGTQGFGHAPIEYGEKHLMPIARKQDLEGFVRGRLKVDPPEPLPRIEEDTATYLSYPAAKTSDGVDIVVNESIGWIEKVTDDARRAMLVRIREALVDIVELGPEDVGKAHEWPVSNNDGWFVCFQWLDDHSLFVFDLKEGDGRIVGALKPDQIKDAGRFVYRTYPDYLLYDEQLWVDLAKDRDGNFFLSKEEMDILQPESDAGLSFPLFIKGRAGSGKSTVLQYIYAEYFARYVKHGVMSGKPPAYFACNAELVRKGGQLVKSILSNNPAYCEDSSIRAEIKNPRRLDGSFFVYRDFLLRQVAEGTRNRLFFPDNYVDYARFNELWEKKFGRTPGARRDYGPDISWHVIRTYIKGMSMEDYLEKEEYMDLPKDQRSVSEAVFARVYESVWEAWYEPLTVQENGVPELWDDQDLARYVLEHENMLKGKNFLGVFCDEAQDFTRIELETFLRMSIYSNRSVYLHDLPRIPFAFAGDEFQTLNPTGFRWEAVKAAFAEKFVLGICPYVQNATQNFKTVDLKNNYRSMPNIVRFGNSVQMLRGAKFGIGDLKPQQEWKLDENTPVTYFEPDDEAFWNAVQTREDIHIIVPCHANEEIDFVEHDPVLRTHVTVDKAKGTTQPPVFSPVRAKGLEYPCVVAYGFGEALDEKIDILDYSDTLRDGEDRTRFLPLEYFLNRLYVAVSRPREQLYLLDTAKGIKKLWTFAESADSLASVKKHIRRGSEWDGHVEPWLHGTSQHLLAGYKSNWEELARQAERTGRMDHDPVSMNYAGNFYMHIKDGRDKANECYALALLYKKDYVAAAQRFEQYKNFLEAGRCYWKMGNNAGWRAMVELCSKDTSLQNDLEYRIARANTSESDTLVAGVLEQIGEIISRGEGANGNVNILTDEWKSAVKELVARFVSMGVSRSRPDLLKVVTSLGAKGLYGDLERLAQCAADAGNYSQARSLLAGGDITKGRLFNKVMFKTEPYPAMLAYRNLSDSEEDASVLAAYRADAGASSLADGMQRQAVVVSFMRAGCLDEVRDMVLSIRDAETFAQIARLGLDDKYHDSFAFASELVRVASLTQYEAIPQIMERHASGKLDDRQTLRLLSLAVGLSKGTQRLSGGDLQSRNNFVQKVAAAWIKMDKASRGSRAQTLEFAIAVNAFAPKDIAFEFMRQAYRHTKDPIYADRAIVIGVDMFEHSHGEKKGAIQRQVESFSNETGRRIRRPDYLRMPELKVDDYLRETFWPANGEPSGLEENVPVEPTTPDPVAEPTAPENEQKEVKETASPAAEPLPEGEVPKAGEEDQAVTPEPSVSTVDNVTAVKMPLQDTVPETATDSGKGDIDIEQDSKEIVPAEDVRMQDAGVEPTSVPGVSVSPAVSTTEAALDAFTLTFSAKKNILNIQNEETMDVWRISPEGLRVDGELRGHVSNMAIDGSAFTVSTSPTAVTLRDVRCGYEFTIRFGGQS